MRDRALRSQDGAGSIRIDEKMKAKFIWFSLLLIIFLAVISFLGFTLLEWPRFIVLPLEPATSQYPSGSWGIESFTTLKIVQQYQRIFIWKINGYAFSTNGPTQFGTAEDVLAFFNSQLENLGWYAIPDEPLQKCYLMVDYENFPENAIVEQYGRLNENTDASFEAVCVVIEKKYSEILDEPMYNVTIATRKLSPISLLIFRSN